MRDIKERVKDKNPKIRNQAARLPKELVRQTLLEEKVLDRKEAHLNEAIMQNRRELSQRHGYYPGICICDSGHHDAEIWRQGNRPDAVFGKSV